MKKLFALFSLPILLSSLSVAAYAQTTSNPNCVVLTTDMGVGATDATTGGQVTKLQNFLQLRGFLKQGLTLGTYGQQTRSAVSSFQKNSGIIQTGYVGPLTRANIQTISCAIGSIDTTNLPTTVLTTGSQPLLTFVSPYAGDLVIKNEKDLGIDWTLASGVLEAFPVASTSIILHLVDSTGTEVASIDTVKLSKGSNGNKVESDFKKAFRERRGTEVIPSGQYKVKATLRMKSSVTDQALIAKAATYASESGWFSIVDPAPKPNLRLSASTNTLLASGPITLTWSSVSGSVCTMYDGSATTNITSSDSKVVTPTQTTTYRVECSLTSAWPFAGSSYTTTEQKKETITIGSTASDFSITSPNGGQVFKLGETMTIKWSTTRDVSNTSLWFRLMKGSQVLGHMKILGPGTFSKSGSTQWKIESIYAGDVGLMVEPGEYKVEATLYQGDVRCLGFCATGTNQNPVILVKDTSDTSFTIQPAQSTGVSLSALSPASGQVGTTVTLQGTGFSSTGNMVYVNGYSSTANYNYAISATGLPSNGTSLSFAIPSTLWPVCSTSGSVGCPAPKTVTPGSYTFTVKNAQGVSNSLPFTVTTTTTYRNFVAGSQSTCNASIVSAYGSQVGTCTIGGGCSMSGLPPTSSNPSANPNMWGACLPSNLTTVAAPTISATANGTTVFNGGRIQAAGGTVSLVWSTTGNPTCTLNGVSVSNSGTQTFTNLGLADYKYTCTNSAGSATLSFSVEVPTVTATTTTGVSKPSITVRANGSRVSNNETVKISNGSVLVEWGGTGAVSCTLNGTSVPTSGSQIFTGVTTASYIYECTNSAGTTELAFDVVLTATANAPTITLKANGSNVANGSTVQAPDGVVSLEWGGVGATSCTLNGNTVPTSGAQIFSGLGTSSYTYTCFNLYGSKTLTFNVVATTGTVTATLSAPTITIKANGTRVSNGETVKISNGTVSVEWGGTGATSCTLNGTSVPTSGSQIFTGVTSSSYTYTCSNSAGTRTVQFSVQDSVATAAPTITIKANGVRVYNGSTVNSSTGTVKFEWGSTGANSCTLNGEPFALSGAQTYTGLTSTTYTYTCSNSAGSKTIQFNVVVPAVLGVSSSCVDLAYNLHRGHESPNVTKLQAFLVSQGLLDETTGFYGDKTVAAVKTYQESKGLPTTGMVYGMTRAAIALDSCQ